MLLKLATTLTSLIIFVSALMVVNRHPLTTEASPLQPSPTPTAIPTATPAPRPSNSTSMPEISARAYVIKDLNSQVILAQKDAAHSLPPASTTKVMTALIALDNYQLNDVVTVPSIKIEGAKINLLPGEKITVEQLLHGLLIQSGNDAAMALAHHFPGEETAFVEAMNRKAAALGLSGTHFVNPTGLHHPLHLSTTADLTRLAEAALTYPKFATIVATATKDITNIDGSIVHSLINLNQLLTTVPGVKGVKTGWTEEAGEALVTLIERNQHPVLIAVLGSADRFGDTKILIDWVYAYTVWN